MGKYSFYCANEQCLALGYMAKNEKIAQELDGKKLCQACYDAGFRLKHGVIVVRNK